MKSSEVPQFGNLKGVNVIAIGSAISYGTAATLLAENGANVITIETPLTTDVIRASYPFIWVQEHRNARFLDINVRVDEGRKVFLDLVAKTDILIAASKGQTFTSWGYSDEVLWEVNPRLTIVHITGYGEKGVEEYVTRPSYDFTTQSFSGYAYMQALPSEGIQANLIKPVGADLITGYMGAFGALIGYLGAQRTGKGESVDVTQYESMLRLQSQFPILGFTFGLDQVGFDGVDQFMVADAFYTSKDGRPLCIAVTGLRQTQNMLPLIGLGDDPRFKGVSTVMKYMDKEMVNDFLEGIRKYAASKNADDIEKEMNALSIPCTRVLKYSEMLDHPHYKAREDIVTYHSDFVDIDVTGPAAFPKCERNPQQIWRGGGIKGQDNEDILRELGISDDEIKDWYERGILEKGDKIDTEKEVANMRSAFKDAEETMRQSLARKKEQ